jgi:PKD repeat protein
MPDFNLRKRAAKFFAILFVFLSAGASAQLSGTYTVGGSGTYASFTAAVNDLTSKGVNGPVIFKVAAGSYNESITIPAITGASATNTVTFTGAGVGSAGTRIYYSLTSSGSAVITLSSASYITIDHMTIENTNSSGSYYPNPATVMMSYDFYNTISNCNIIAPNSSSTPYNFYSLHMYYSSYGTVKNNHLSGGMYGLYNEATSYTSGVSYGHALVKNNRFVAAYYNHIYGYGYMYGLVGDVYDGNTFDSSASPYISALQLSYECGATVINNITNGNVTSYIPIEIDDPNYGSSTYPFLVYNNMIGNFSYEGIYLDAYSSGTMNLSILHNTIDEENSSPTYLMYAYFSGATDVTIENNIFSTSSTALPMYLNTPNPPVNFKVDGNDYYNTGGNLVTFNGSSYATVADFGKVVASYGWAAYDNNMKPHYKSKRDLHFDQSFPNPSGVYAGIDKDIDGDARCKLFPSAGADESTYGTGSITVKFFLPAKIYPNSPTYVYQIAKAGEPKRHAWYLNGVHVSDSIVLFTSKFVVGSNTLKLVTTTCFGKDSSTQVFTVTAPTAVPGTDFIANKNTIQAGGSVAFKDLSTNGPTKWQWTITPDSTYDNGTKVSTVKYIFGNNAFQNPEVKFNYGGKYKVCMTASNSVGKGATLCKTNYINVIPTINIGSVPVVKDAAGYLYDNGGPNNNYTAVNTTGHLQSILIDPCADSVFLTFSMFDTYCGYDYVRLFEGKDNTGRHLWSSACNSTGSSGYGPGYTGGKAYSCSFTCMPNVLKPDTFKAAKSMYIEMVSYIAYNSAGFAAYWWSKPRTATKPKASFTTSNAGDSACVNASLNFTNTTSIDPKDPASFLWDLDGDITTFECAGTCATASYPYFLAGPVTVTLIATNCGGSDTATRTLTIYNPKPPKAAFTADNLTPTTSEVVFFTSEVPQCVDDYLWTITPSSGTTGKAVFVNGTSAQSANPQVNFTGVGYYDVRMDVDNASGAQKDAVTKLKYINARNPYCIPSVATSNQGLGITKVVFNTISNKMAQASQEYSNFVSNPSLSTTIAIGASYNLTVSRDPNLLFNPANRVAFIDWNQDGSFSGPGEIISLDSNTYDANVTKKITVPKTAKIGATVMRIAVNLGSYANKPCGQNEFGEYQDYRLYVTPYNILPVITLKGHQGIKDTMYLEQGVIFVEPGYSASSFLYGNITANVTVNSKMVGGSGGPYNSVVPGTYIFSYDVTDSAGNKAVTQVRYVTVTKDKTPPALIVAGSDTSYIEVTKTAVHPVPVPKVISADDLVDGPLAGSVIIDSGKVNTSIVGTYIVSYTVSDLSGNTAVVYRVIKVIDTIRPVMTLLGNDPMKLEVGNAYVEPGVSISDNYNTSAQLNSRVVINSNLDVTRLGTYTVTYQLTDLSGNQAATLTRTVIVIDTIAPVITLIGAQLDSVEVFHPYTDLGVTVSDNYNNVSDIAINVTGTFYTQFTGGKNPNLLGSYTIIYTATDKSGNKSTVTRTVLVKDHQAPVIALKGDVGLSTCRWFKYVDAGYTVTDNYDPINKITVDTEGTFITHGHTTMYGIFSLRYRAKDGSGNIGYSAWRIIQVKPETDYTCTSGIMDGLSLDQYIQVYPNPNTGIFTIKASFPSQHKARISVTNMLGQEIAVIHNGILDINSFQVDLSTQPGGMYMLNIVTENQTLTKRIEIAR